MKLVALVRKAWHLARWGKRPIRPCMLCGDMTRSPRHVHPWLEPLVVCTACVADVRSGRYLRWRLGLQPVGSGAAPRPAGSIDREGT